jgi:hypothetical protein
MAIAGSAAAGPLGRAAMPLVKGLGSSVLKTFGTREVVSEAAESLLGKWLGPRIPSAVLYQQAKELGQIIPAAQTGQTIKDIVGQELWRAPTEVRGQILSVLQPLRKYFPDMSKGVRGMSVADMMEESQRLRSAASSAFNTPGSEKLGMAIDKVREAMLKDMESQGAGVVREAPKAYRKEMALERLGTLMSKPGPVSKIKDFAKDNSLFKGAFDQQEQEQILRIARKMSTVAPSGGSGVIGKIATTAAGGSAGGVEGAAIGYLAPEAIRAVLATKFGRDFAEKILAGTTTLDHPRMAALAMFARGMMGEQAQ